MIRHKGMKRIGLLLVAFMLLLQSGSLLAGEVRNVGGFAVAQDGDGKWLAAYPQDLADSFGKATLEGVDTSATDRIVIKTGSVSVKWEDEQMGLAPRIAGSAIPLMIRGWGTFAKTPSISLYKDNDTVKDIVVSYFQGNALDILPEGARIVGLGVTEGEFKASFPADDHTFHDLDGKDGKLLYATIEYVVDDGKATSLDQLPHRFSLSFLGLDITVEEGKNKYFECQWSMDGEPSYASGNTGTISLGDIEINSRSFTTKESGTVRKYSIPADQINNIVDLGLTEDVAGFMLKTPTETQFVATIPGDLAIPIPGLDDKLRFNSTNLRLGFRAGAVGSSLSISMETTIANPGILFGPLADKIGTNKKVGITIENKTLVINFYNTLEDLKPLGFSLSSPVIAVDFEDRAVRLSGTINFPDNMPIPIGNSADVVCDISKDNFTVTVLNAVDMNIFDDKINLSMETIVLGKAQGGVYFAAVGKAKLNEDISLLPGLEIFKKAGVNLTTGVELTANIFVQTNGFINVELVTSDLLDLNVGPVNSKLEEIKLCLSHEPRGQWEASISGKTSLAMDLGIFKLNATTEATLSTDGSLTIAIPEDPDNPTQIELQGIATLTIVSGSLKIQAGGADAGVKVDAVVALTLSDKVPVIGGKPLKGHVAMATDGSFVFEGVDMPQLEWQNMKFGLSVLKIENKVENNSMVLSASIGGQIEFTEKFVLAPLRGNRLAMVASIQSNPAKATIALEGPFKLTAPGPDGKPGDFSFIFNRIALSVGQAGISASGTAGVEVLYPSSKYFGIGLPAALANKPEGPSFQLGATVTIGQNFVYFSTADDYNPIEIPVDIPGFLEGITVQLNSIGGGVAYLGAPIPLFDVAGRVYLPKVNGGGDFTTQTLKRPYDSYVGLVLAATMEKPFMCGFEISKEHPPSIKVGDFLEVDIREVALSIWLNATSIDFAGKLRVGNPEKGFGFLMDMLPPEGETDNGHLCIFSAGPYPIPIPFHRNLDIHTRIAGFETRLNTQFARPKIGLQDMLTYAPLMFEIIKSQDWERLRTELKEGGQLADTIAKLKLKDAYMAFPKELGKVFTKLPKTDDGRPKLTIFNNIVIDPTDAVLALTHIGEVITRPSTLPTKLVHFVPEDKRKGNLDINLLDLLDGNIRYEITAAEAEFQKEAVAQLPEVIDVIDVANEILPRIPVKDESALVITLDDKRKVNVGKTTFIDVTGASKKIIQCVDSKALPNGTRKSSRELLNHLWRDSIAHSSKSGVSGDRIVFRRNDRNGVSDSYNIRVDVEKSFGIPITGTKVGPNANMSNSGVWGSKAVIPTSFPASVSRSFANCSYRRGLTIYRTAYSLDGKYVTSGKGAVNLNLGLRGSSVSQEKILFWYRTHASQNAMIDDRGRLTRNITLPVMSERGWNGNNMTLADFSVDSKVSEFADVNVSKWGEVTASIAGGQMVLRTTLKNSPATDALKLRSVIQTMDLGTIEDRDTTAARAWKRLWDMHTGRPTVKSNVIYLNLKDGSSVRFYLPKIVHRYPIRVPYISRWEWKRKWIIWYLSPVWSTKYAYTPGYVNQMTVDGSGRVKVRCYTSKWGKYCGWQTLFDPAKTDKDYGTPDIVSVSKNPGRPGLEHNAKGNVYKFYVSRPGSWSAYTDTANLWIYSPDKTTSKLSCDQGLSERLRKFGSSSNDGYSFGEPGTFIVNGPAGTGPAKNVEQIIGFAGGDTLSMPRLISWRGSKGKRSVKLHTNGCLSEGYGLKPLGPGMSTTTLVGSKTGHKYLLKVQGDAITASFDDSKGNTRNARIVRSTGQIEYPSVNANRDGFLIDGSLRLGMTDAVAGETEFHGEIYSDGDFDLSGAARMWVLGQKLSDGRIRCSRSDGLYVKGEINAPLLKSMVEGTLQKNYFCLRGNVNTLYKGTGIVGNLVVDTKGMNASGKIYLLNKMIANGKIIVRQGELSVSFGAKASGKFIVRYTVGFNCDATLRVVNKHPSAKLALCFYIDASWPIGYRSISFTIQTPEKLEIKKKVGPVWITIDLMTFKVKVSK